MLTAFAAVEILQGAEATMEEETESINTRSKHHDDGLLLARAKA